MFFVMECFDVCMIVDYVVIIYRCFVYLIVNIIYRIIKGIFLCDKVNFNVFFFIRMLFYV